MHELVATVTGILGVACIADFLFLIDYAARLLRPVSVVAKRRRRGHGDDQRRLSGPGDRAAAGGRCAARTARDAQPRGRAPRRVGNRARGRHPDAGGAGATPRRHDRVLAAGRGFRRRGRAAVRAPRRRDGDRRPRSAVGGGLRSRTHARAGSDVRVPDHRRHRAEGLVAGDQRPDDRGGRPRPGASAAAAGGPAEAARRGHPRRRRAAARHLPHAELGALRPGRVQRDSRMRRQQPAGRAPHARDAREPPEHAAGTPARGAGHGTRLAGLGDPDALQPARGARAGQDPRYAGAGRIVGRAPGEGLRDTASSDA